MLTEVKLLKNGYQLAAKNIKILFDPQLEDTIPADAQWLVFTVCPISQTAKDKVISICGDHPKAKILISETLKFFFDNNLSEFKNVHVLNKSWFKLSDEISVLGIFNEQNQNISEFETKPTPEHTTVLSLAGYVARAHDTQLLVLGEQAIPCQDIVEKLSVLGSIQTAAITIATNNRFNNSKDPLNHVLTTHEAIGLAEQLKVAQVVIRPTDSVTPNEIKAVHAKHTQSSQLLIEPQVFYLGKPSASVIIRTLNEDRYLNELLTGIREQRTQGLNCEIVIVDSGSTDGTLDIAEKHGCTIVHIKREEFSFGRSLNIGCHAAKGEVLVITSGHCVPAHPDWLHNLCQPLLNSTAQYSYGKQLGGPNSYFSECRVFEKYFPNVSKLPQEGFYCNNANSALLKTTWQRHRFNEELTGLEDMALAQKMLKEGGKIAYVANAPVYHYHSENWSQVRRRFEREAIALQQIMPNVHVGWFDTIRYTLSSIWVDIKKATESKQLFKNLTPIIRYRYYQYTGSYRGNKKHRKLSQTEKDQYFYPN
jgi:glycosyltransferase involved in cell wall biosynthesis